jgi:hypothetical protein
VEAKRLGISLEEVTAALAAHWRRLDSPHPNKGERKRR